MTPEDPILISCGVGAIGLIGIIAGMIARSGVAKEKKLLEDGEAQFLNLAASGGRDRETPRSWLKSKGMPEDSHFGDRVISVWDGWRAHRIPPLIELHSVSAGRERRRLSARMAAGITGLLVVSGIAGTLICIHPILDGFNITANSNGTVDASKRTDAAMEMIKSLGRAFWPSLTALLVTFLVASARGVYQHSASKLAWDLDHFTVDVLFGNFPERSQKQEINDLHTKLVKLVDHMAVRDESLGDLITKLTANIGGLRLSEDNLTSAANSISAATANMTSEAAQVRAGFAAHLGENSPVIKGLAAIGSAAHANASVASQLQQTGQVLSDAAASAIGQLHHARQQLDASITEARNHVVESNLKAAALVAAKIGEAGAKAAASLHKSVAEVPKMITASMEHSASRMEEVLRRYADSSTAPADTVPVPDFSDVQTELDSTDARLEEAHENARQSTWSAEAILDEETRAIEERRHNREAKARAYVPPASEPLPETTGIPAQHRPFTSPPPRVSNRPLHDPIPKSSRKNPKPEKMSWIGRIKKRWFGD